MNWRPKPVVVRRPISTIFYVKRHISRLPNETIFSTRDFLSYGHRASVDQCLSRMVKRGLIVRLARGLFIKPLQAAADLPPVHEVAKAKAEAFGRNVYMNGVQAAVRLGFSEAPPSSNEVVFATDGHSSSFQYGNIRIKFKTVPNKYLKLKDDFPALAIRAFLHFGKSVDTKQILYHTSLFLWREDKYALRMAARWMPLWLSERIFKQPTYDYAQLKLRRTFDSLPSKQHTSTDMTEINKSFRAKWPGSAGVPLAS